MNGGQTDERQFGWGGAGAAARASDEPGRFYDRLRIRRRRRLAIRSAVAGCKVHHVRAPGAVAVISLLMASGCGAGEDTIVGVEGAAGTETFDETDADDGTADIPRPSVPAECSDLQGGELRKCMDLAGSLQPPQSIGLPPGFAEAAARMEARSDDCLARSSEYGGRVAAPLDLDVVGSAALNARLESEFPIVVSCGTTSDGDLLVVATEAMLTRIDKDSLEAIVGNWLVGSSKEENAIGLFTPLQDAAGTLISAKIEDGVAAVVFSEELLDISSSWGLPGWDTRFMTELGWNVALVDEVEAFTITVDGECYERILYQDFDSSDNCEAFSVLDSATRRIIHSD